MDVGMRGNGKLRQKRTYGWLDGWIDKNRWFGWMDG